MISPGKLVNRSPLKATDANANSNVNATLHTLKNSTNANYNANVLDGKPVLKKRSLERLEQLNIDEDVGIRKRPKIERNRSIEGAVVQNTSAHTKLGKINDQNGISNSNTNVKNSNNNNNNNNNKQGKVSLNELLEWQNNWKKIMRRESKIYFDTTDDSDINKYMKLKLEKKKDLLKGGFTYLGAQITQFFDTSVTIVITRRSIDKIHLLPETDVLSRAKRNYMKVWNYEKSTRFLKNLDVDLDQLDKNKNNSLNTTTSLSNLLQNEKLYGPADRDPRTRRDDVHYFKYSYVYMYDLWQTWAPILTLEWKPQELTDANNVPYPTLKIGTFGRCPFIGDGSCDEMSYKRVVKRYTRDKANKSYALRLRQLYQYHAEPNADKTQFVVIPHICLDSKKCYNKWQQLLIISHSKLGNNQGSEYNPKNLTLTSAEKEDISKIEKDNVSVIEGNKEITEDGNIENEVLVKDSKLLINKNDTCNQIADTSATNWREPLKIPARKSLSNLSLNGQKILGSLVRQETEEFPNDLCNIKAIDRFPQEIKASGVHQSNDVATSFGNGLGPTKSSVMSKNLKSLSRLVVDRKLGVNSKTNTASTLSNKVSDNHEINSQQQSNNKYNNKNDSTKEALIEANDNSPGIDDKAILKKIPTSKTQQQQQQQQQQRTKVPAIMKSSGYCENCRVKYESLDIHINSERHQSFAQNEINFESIDSLISKLHFQF